MPFEAFFDSPENYNGRFTFYKQGGSPGLLNSLIKFIEQRKDAITEVNLCWYLFNNVVLYEYLKSLSEYGIKVNIITIPNEGYDNRRPQKLTELNTGAVSENYYTKYDLARKIFADAYRQETNDNLKIYFFPHLYVRSPNMKPFSRGALPYSLHLKAGFIKKKNGYAALISSSSMAARDLVKNESMVIVEDEPEYVAPIQKFFSDIMEESIQIKEFKKEYNTRKNEYPPKINMNNKAAHFTAPFYFDSPHELEEQVINMIKNANFRVIICAQHLAAYNYKFYSRYHSAKEFDETRKGILGYIVDKANEGIKITCISQTFSPPRELQEHYNNIRFREPANKLSFANLIWALSEFRNVSYYVNEDFHSKFIIVDNTLVFCSYNFTPTQFIYLDNVDIKEFKNMPDMSYKGQFSEVMGHFVIDDPRIVAEFEANVKKIIGFRSTIKTLPVVN